MIFMNKFLFSLCLGLIFTANSFAQQDSIFVEKDSIISVEKNKLWKNLKYDVSTVGGGFVNTFTQPIRWKKDDYMIAGATVVGVSLLYLGDEQTSDFFRRQKNDIPEGLLYSGWVFGRPEASYGLTTGIYLFGLFTDNEKVRETGVLLFTAAAATGLFQQTMKTATGRARPDIGIGKNQFRLFRGGHAYGSFPSGHTILSTTVVYGLSKQFSNPWVKGGLYAIGLITPMNRLVEGAHWLTDVVLSAVVSIAMVEGIDNYLKKKKKYSYADDNEFGFIKKKGKKDKIKWSINFTPSSLGVVGVF